MARPWHRHARQRLGHSLKARLVALFLLLALALAGTFLFGMQKVLGGGWREAARPLLADYVDRLVAEIGSPPDRERAEALTRRLPVKVRIDGPKLVWDSGGAEAAHGHWRERSDEGGLLVRHTADGHRIEFGLAVQPWRERPRLYGWFTLATLLLLTALAYRYVRRLLRPLDDIRAGARRFGAGGFAQPIPVRRADELGDLASDVNAMAGSIHQMLEAKRGLLLAMSHELRSPLTRARLHTELLPEGGEAGVRREALLRDLHEMAQLVADLLESERLGAGHAALQRQPADLVALVREVAATFDGPLQLQLPQEPVVLALDRARMRLLLRNLMDNALRHNAPDAAPPVVALRQGGGNHRLSVRDFGPGVDAATLPHLAEPFYRPDAARERATGGVGLGLYLCKLVAQAHGGGFELSLAQPGLMAEVTLPA
jgi:signal transduction histidine kinase